MEKKICVKCGVKPTYGSNVDDRCSSCANKATLCVLMQLAAITLFILAAIYPPWEKTILYLDKNMQAEEFYGFRFLWDKPRLSNVSSRINNPYMTQDITKEHINIHFIFWVGELAVLGTATLLFLKYTPLKRYKL